MKKDHQCSLQYHNKKRIVYVLSGKLQVTVIRNKKKILTKGQNILIKPKEIQNESKKQLFFQRQVLPKLKMLKIKR